MSGTKKQKDCYRSMDNSRKPICKRSPNSQCILCQQAEIRYNIARQEILQIRKMKNRQSAMRSRDNQALKWDDLLAENYALENEKWEAANTLATIEWEKQQLMSAIYNKNMEKAWYQDQVISNVANMIIQHPEDTVIHLHSTFGNIMEDEQETIIARVHPDVSFAQH